MDEDRIGQGKFIPKAVSTKDMQEKNDIDVYVHLPKY